MAEKAPSSSNLSPNNIIDNRQNDSLIQDVTDISSSPAANRIPHYRQVWDPLGLTHEVIHHPYAGSGTKEDPFVVTWIPADPRNPMLYSAKTRWSIMMVVAMCALMVSLCSSAYSGATGEVSEEFGVGEEVVVLGISLFVLGFAVG